MNILESFHLLSLVLLLQLPLFSSSTEQASQASRPKIWVLDWEEIKNSSKDLASGVSHITDKAHSGFIVSSKSHEHSICRFHWIYSIFSHISIGNKFASAPASSLNLTSIPFKWPLTYHALSFFFLFYCCIWVYMQDCANMEQVDVNIILNVVNACVFIKSFVTHIFTKWSFFPHSWRSTPYTGYCLNSCSCPHLLHLFTGWLLFFSLLL